MQVRITPSKLFAPDLKGRITRPQVPVTSPEFDAALADFNADLAEDREKIRRDTCERAIDMKCAQ